MLRVKKIVRKEKARIIAERAFKDQLQKYWANMLSEEQKTNREYNDVYDELFDYSRVTIENSLRPLKEYYFNNPHDFDPGDPTLMDKAFKYAER